jgi:uncharacterized membrane protein YeaQ/YmgE (transglycosylase-associated protein family)
MNATWNRAEVRTSNQRLTKDSWKRSKLSLCGSLFRGMVMTIEALIIWLVIGAVAGWLAGLIMEGYGFGLIGNIVVGIVGALIAGWLLPKLGFVLIGGIGAAIINAVIGAVILLAAIGFVRKAA